LFLYPNCEAKRVSVDFAAWVRLCLVDKTESGASSGQREDDEFKEHDAKLVKAREGSSKALASPAQFAVVFPANVGSATRDDHGRPGRRYACHDVASECVNALAPGVLQDDRKDKLSSGFMTLSCAYAGLQL